MPATAEFACSGSVSYHWKKEKDEKPSEVHWRSLSAVGKDEDLAKRALFEAQALEKNKALKACATEHENVAGCVSSKFSSNAHTYNALSFSARKALEDAITKDCAVSQGICLEAKASDPTCKELAAASAEASPSGTPSTEEKGKTKAKK